MSSKTISINRAPVLTLWASVVAERLGFDQEEALSLGKALAGLTAQSKGRRLGIYRPHEGGAEKARKDQIKVRRHSRTKTYGQRCWFGQFYTVAPGSLASSHVDDDIVDTAN